MRSFPTEGRLITDDGWGWGGPGGGGAGGG
jgi:hypothetical protein